ncbi:MAG: hypothetical protein ACYTE8_03875 [Planctomycetota bacterium]|jgi:hypothetical protein
MKRGKNNNRFIETITKHVVFSIVHPLYIRIENRKIKKIGLKAYRRQKRINKVTAPHMIPFLLPLPICLFLLAVVFESVDHFNIIDLDQYNSFKEIAFFIIFLTCFFIWLPGIISGLVYNRLFIKKKGKNKAMKYICPVKERYRFLNRLWLRMCGINDSDIQKYLSKKSIQ